MPTATLASVWRGLDAIYLFSSLITLSNRATIWEDGMFLSP